MLLHVHQQQRDRGRRHARQPRRRPDASSGDGAPSAWRASNDSARMSLKSRSLGNQGRLGLARDALDVRLLLVDVAGIAGGGLDLVDDLIGELAPSLRVAAFHVKRRRPPDADCATESIGRPPADAAGRASDRAHCRHRLLRGNRRRGSALSRWFHVKQARDLRRKRRPARVVDQAEPPPDLGQAQVGVVLAQLQPVFGAAREHPVRLGHALGDQVVDQDAEIGLVARRHPRRVAPRTRAPR